MYKGNAKILEDDYIDVHMVVMKYDDGEYDVKAFPINIYAERFMEYMRTKPFIKDAKIIYTKIRKF